MPWTRGSAQPPPARARNGSDAAAEASAAEQPNTPGKVSPRSAPSPSLAYGSQSGGCRETLLDLISGEQAKPAAKPRSAARPVDPGCDRRPYRCSDPHRDRIAGFGAGGRSIRRAAVLFCQRVHHVLDVAKKTGRSNTGSQLLPAPLAQDCTTLLAGDCCLLCAKQAIARRIMDPASAEQLVSAWLFSPGHQRHRARRLVDPPWQWASMRSFPC